MNLSPFNLRRQILCKPLCLSLLCLFSLTACQRANPSGAPVGPERVQPELVGAQPVGSSVLPSRPWVASGHVRSVGSQVQVQLQYQQPGFQTRAFGCDEVAFVKLEASGPGFATLYATGADDQHMLPTANCHMSGVFNNVPYGTVLVKARLYTADRELLSASEVATAFSLQSTAQVVELSARQSPLAWVVEALLNADYASEFLLNSLDFGALQDVVDTLTGVSGSFPQYSYTTPPALIDSAALAQQLILAQGDVSALDLQDPSLRLAPAQINLNLAGALPGQSLTLSVNDSLSSNLTTDQNGPRQITDLAPGTWQLRITGEGYLSQVIPVTVTAGQSLELGTITLKPLPPVLTSVSDSAGSVDQTLVLTGSQFSPVASNNQVYFGTVAATVNSVNAAGTSLSVTVPATAGRQDIRVVVGEESSESLAFEVVPVVQSLSLSSGSTGDEITLNGSGFASDTSANQVAFGGTAATVVSVGQNGTSLTVRVPERPAGATSLAVTVGNHTSTDRDFTVKPSLVEATSLATQAGQAVLVQNQTLTLSGTNFDPVAANNHVFFGGTSVVASTATATQLTVQVPALNGGEVTLSVRVNAQDSENLTAVAPLGQWALENGGFY